MLQNSRHEHFAQLVAKGVNQTEAAKAAGYSEKTACEQGSRLFRNVQIKARVDELRDRVSEQAVASIAIDKAWILTRLVELSAKCLSDDKWSPAAAAKSLELLGKDLGMFRDYVRIDVFNDMMAQMGAAVARWVTDATVLEQIVSDWEEITTEPRKLKTDHVET